MVGEPIDIRFDRLKEKMFLLDAVYFMVLCIHKIEFTESMRCGICCGGGKIYLSPSYFADKTDEFLEESVKIELLRCLLGHPYRAKDLNKVYSYLASNLVCANNMTLRSVKLKKSSDVFGSSSYNRECFETFYDMFMKNQDEKNKSDRMTGPSFGSGYSSGGQDNADGKNKGESDEDKEKKEQERQEKRFKNYDDGCQNLDDAIARSSQWGEDDLKIAEINNIIDKIDGGNLWGNLPGDIQELIKSARKPSFNYRAIFHQFKSILPCSKQTVTRMKPNRRLACTPQAFGSLGHKHSETAKLLVAIDTSGSISDEEYAKALGFINGFFTTNIESIWSIQWDTTVKEDSFKRFNKKVPNHKRHGYGGTDVTCVFDWLEKSNQTFSGCIIFTDGYFSYPQIKALSKYKNTKFLFVLNNKQNFDNFHSQKEFAKIGKCTFVK